jgi:hypothetical protein
MTLRGKLKEPGRWTLKSERVNTGSISVRQVATNHTIIVSIPVFTLGLNSELSTRQINTNPVTSGILSLGSVGRSESEYREKCVSIHFYFLFNYRE